MHTSSGALEGPRKLLFEVPSFSPKILLKEAILAFALSRAFSSIIIHGFLLVAEASDAWSRSQSSLAVGLSPGSRTKIFSRMHFITLFVISPKSGLHPEMKVLFGSPVLVKLGLFRVASS